MRVEPYLSFEGRCEEAIAFYKSALGAKVDMLMRYKDSPEPHPSGKFPPEVENKIMHASLRVGDTTVMLSDGRNTGKLNFAGINLSLSVSSDADAKQLFASLADGGAVTMPVTKTFFASSFGMVTDRFGVSWMILTHA